MAFVFRSQKRSLFERGEQEYGLQQDQGQVQIKSKGQIYRGVAYMLQNDKLDSRQKVNQGKQFALAEDSIPIHFLVDMQGTKKQMRLDSNKPTKTVSGYQQNLQKCLSAAELRLQKDINNNSGAKSSNYRLRLKQFRNSKNLLVSKGEGGEEVRVVNRNLRKTLQELKFKIQCPQTISLNQIIVANGKQNCNKSNGDKRDRQQNFKFLKRLSPIREYARLLHSLNPKANLPSVKNAHHQQSSKHKLKLPRAKMIAKAAPLSQQQQQQQQTEYCKEATPGPGSYEYSASDNNFRSKRQKFQKIFISSLQRFPDNQLRFQEVTYVNDSQDKSSSPSNLTQSASHAFVSKSPKLASCVDTGTPPPGYYDTRQNLEHDLVRKILRSSNTNTFINRSPRSNQFDQSNQKSQLPGPGCYEVDRSLQKISEQKDKGSFCFKSELPRNLDDGCGGLMRSMRKEELDLMQSESTQKIGPIHVKDTILEDSYVIQKPPFLTGTQRFPDVIDDSTTMLKYSAKEACSFVKPVKRQPFNSSEKREKPMLVGQGVGTGLYNTEKKWTKRSFNILFN